MKFRQIRKLNLRHLLLIRIIVWWCNLFEYFLHLSDTRHPFYISIIITAIVNSFCCLRHCLSLTDLFVFIPMHDLALFRTIVCLITSRTILSAILSTYQANQFIGFFCLSFWCTRNLLALDFMSFPISFLAYFWAIVSWLTLRAFKFRFFLTNLTLLLSLTHF